MANLNIENAIDLIVDRMKIELPLAITSVNSQYSDSIVLREIPTANFIYSKDADMRRGRNEFFYFEELEEVDNQGDDFNWYFPYRINCGIAYLDNSNSIDTEEKKLRYNLRYRQALLIAMKNTMMKIRGEGVQFIVNRLNNITGRKDENKLNVIQLTITIAIGE
jgi:hypothetical protein